MSFCTIKEILSVIFNLAIIMFCISIPHLIAFFAYRNSKKDVPTSRNNPSKNFSKSNRFFLFFDTITSLLPKYLIPLAIVAISCFILSYRPNRFSDTISKMINEINTGNIPSMVLSFILATIGMLSIFTALKQKYCAFISTKDVLHANRVITKIIHIVCHYLLYTCFSGISVWINYFSAPTIPEHLLILQGCEMYCLFMSVFYALSLLYTLLKILFSAEDPRLLNGLYRTVHNLSRTRNENLNQENYYSIDASIDYLISLLYTSDIIDTHKSFESKKIESISFMDGNFGSIPKSIQHYAFFTSFLFPSASGLSFSLGLHPILYSIIFPRLDYPPLYILIGILLCILPNLIVFLLLFSRNSSIRNFYIRIAIGSSGFKLKNPQETDTACYFSEHYKYGNRKSTEQECIHRIYNIISLFRDTLDAGHDLALYSLNQIEKNIQGEDCGYMLYMLCAYLFCKEYPNEKATLSEKFQKKFTDNHDQKAILEHNVSELAKDILRDHDAPTWSDIFDLHITHNTDAFCKEVNPITPSLCRFCLHTKHLTFKFEYKKVKRP